MLPFSIWWLLLKMRRTHTYIPLPGYFLRVFPRFFFFFFFFKNPQFYIQNNACTRKQYKVCHVFKKCKCNSILMTVEITLKRHKESPCCKVSNNKKEVCTPGSQFCSFLANKKRLSHNCTLRSHATGGEVLIVQFRFGKVRNHVLRGGGNKSNQSHSPPEQAAPTALQPVGYLSETQEERHSAGSSSTPAHGKAGI